MPSDKVIVSFASHGREDYNKAQLRMIDSCINAGWRGDFLIRSLDGPVDHHSGVPIITGSYPGGSERTHEIVPYGFKPDMINEAVAFGYKTIVWMDSTMLMRHNITPLLEYASKHGVAAFDNYGFPLENWISDVAVARTSPIGPISEIKQIMACCIIFDVSKEAGMYAFSQWLNISRDGMSFQESGSIRSKFIAHRHDQAVLSVLLHNFSIPLLPYGNLVYHPAEEQEEYKNAFLINKGL